MPAHDSLNKNVPVYVPVHALGQAQQRRLPLTAALVDRKVDRWIELVHRLDADARDVEIEAGVREEAPLRILVEPPLHDGAARDRAVVGRALRLVHAAAACGQPHRDR